MTAARRRRILLVGWDAADWKSIRPLLDAGEMPNLARLMAGGVHGNLATIHPPLSPMLWTSIATGKRPYKHGIHGFSEPLPDGTGVRPVSTLSRRTKALWNIFHQQGLRSVVVGWWPSHPAEPIRGAMVSNHFSKVHGAPDRRSAMPAGTVHPESWVGALADLRVSPMELTGEFLRLFVPEYDRVDQSKDRRLHTLARIVAETMTVHAAATELLAGEDWDFAAVYYDAIDHFGHAFMPYHPPRRAHIPEADFELYRHVLASGYRYHDGMLGTLLRHADEDTTVLLMSDHGFHSDHLRPGYIPAEPAGPAVEHRHFGILVLRGPEIRRGDIIHGASILDVCPTLLAVAGLPAGRDMDGKILVNAFQVPPVLKTIESWDDEPGDAGLHPEGLRLDPVASAEAFRQLVELGYVAPPGPDVRAYVEETSRELQYNLARALADGGQLEKAIGVLRPLWQRWPREHRFGLALMAALRRTGAGAERRAALTDFEARLEHWRIVAAAELAALESKQEASPSDSKPAPAAINAGNGERRMGFRRRQLEELSCPRPRLVAWLWVTQLLLEGNRSEARDRCHAFLDTGDLPQEMGPAVLEVLHALGESDAARSLAERLLQSDPENAEVLARLAELELESGHLEAAVAAAVNSLALVYFQPGLQLILARGLLATDQPEEAEAAACVAVSQSPHLAAGHEFLADLYRGRLQRPRDAFRHEGMARTLLDQQAIRKRAPRTDGEAEKRDGMEVVPSLEKPAMGEADPKSVVTVVSGLPRSGTSMMMQVLEAAGLVPLTDGIRGADEDNPLGYLEFDRATQLARDSTWVPRGRGGVVKVVAQLLPWLPRGEQYRVVFLRRDLREVVASQHAMLGRLGRPEAELDDAGLMAAYRTQLEGVRHALASRPEVAVLEIEYARFVADPEPDLLRLQAFLGRDLDREEAARAVRPELRRQKAGERS